MPDIDEKEKALKTKATPSLTKMIDYCQISGCADTS